MVTARERSSPEGLKQQLHEIRAVMCPDSPIGLDWLADDAWGSPLDELIQVHRWPKVLAMATWLWAGGYQPTDAGRFDWRTRIHDIAGLQRHWDKLAAEQESQVRRRLELAPLAGGTWCPKCQANAPLAATEDFWACDHDTRWARVVVTRCSACSAYVDARAYGGAICPTCPEQPSSETLQAWASSVAAEARNT